VFNRKIKLIYSIKNKRTESLISLSRDEAQKYISVIILSQNDLYLINENADMFKFVAKKTKEM
jgi:hypothetical protein